MVELSRDEVASNFGRSLPEGEAEAVLQFLDDAAARNSEATDIVESILGRLATRFAKWAIDHADESSELMS